jgi:hypothetical protein
MREDIPISKRLRAGFMVNTDMEYMAELRYIINKNVVYVPIMIVIWDLVLAYLLIIKIINSTTLSEV